MTGLDNSGRASPYTHHDSIEAMASTHCTSHGDETGVTRLRPLCCGGSRVPPTGETPALAWFP
jgi:hypothetical protein